MKANTHPKYFVTEVVCGCGATFVTRSTKPQIKLEICSECHPFYTGRQKFVDTAGRVEKFTRKYNWSVTDDGEVEAEPPAAPKAPAKRAKKTDSAPQTLKGLAKKQKKVLAEKAKEHKAAKKADEAPAEAPAEAAAETPSEG